MPTSYTIGNHFESFVQDQLASGRYNNASEVIREALRLMETRDLKLQSLRDRLNTSIARGGEHSDEDVGRALDNDEAEDDRNGL